MLELKHISKIYNPGLVTEMCLFDDFNLSVKDGEFVSVIGSNGSGKTSMLNIICGSIPVNGGEVLINGKCINRQKDFERYSHIGRVYQNPAMGNCPNMTILENMSLADNKGKPFGLSFALNKKRFDNYREQLASLGLGLEDKLNNMPSNLSGGQQQRVAIARALVSKPAIVLADEPTGNLDSMTSSDVLSLLKVTSTKFHQTLVMITHNSEIAQLADRIIRIEDGKIVR